MVTQTASRKSYLSNILAVLYAGAWICTVVVFLVTWFIEPGDNKSVKSDIKWYADSSFTETADLKHPVLRDGKCEFYMIVPEDLPVGDGLWFRTKNAEVEIFVDGESRAAVTKSEHAAFYGKTVGTDWVYVPFDTQDAGKTVRISFAACYSDKSSYLSEVHIGNTMTIIRTLIDEKIFGAIMCILIAFTGIILVIVYVALRPYIEGMPKGLLYIGVCAVATAVWLFSELRIIQIFTDKPAGIIHNLTCMSLMLISLPLIYYFKEELDKINKYIVYIVSGISIANFVICTVLHFMGIMDYHNTLTFTHITLGITAEFVIIANFIRCFGNREKSSVEFVSAIAMILVGVATIVDMLRYNSGMANDSAFFTRIAGFIYIISLAVSNLAYVVAMVRKGLRTDIVSRLAYEDGLTGLGNRTAYTEDLDEIHEGETATVFVFDINNLKYVNDNIGHIAGDKLIVAAADIISKSFSAVGKCYRIGGDEFVCIVKGEVNCEEYGNTFYKNIAEFNRSGKLEFTLMVALGYETYRGSGSVKETVDNADRNMYIKKAQLKAAM